MLCIKLHDWYGALRETCTGRCAGYESTECSERLVHKIVVVGGGAGGLELATRLGDTLGAKGIARVTLVDRCPTHLWKPLLHEVAAGSLDREVHQLEFAAQAHWHDFEFVQGEFVSLDRASKTIGLGAVFDTEDGQQVLPSRTLPYDTLVLALGSQTHFFGVSGAKEHTIPLDTPEQAERLRRRLLRTCMTMSACNQSGKGATVNVAIIGGGATGVELSAELRRMEKVFSQYGLHAPGQTHGINITLLEAGPRLLPALSERVAHATAVLLQDMGITVLVADPVIDVRPDGVLTRSGKHVATDITIWAAGIKAPDVLMSLDGIEVNKMNQVCVNNMLQSLADADIFALGDCASCAWTSALFVPPRAQAANQQASFLAKALKARLRGRSIEPFRYIDRGSLVSLGSASAVGSLMGGVIGSSILIEGLIARVMYAALYQKHLAAVAGVRRMVARLLIQGLRRTTSPRVKLH
ncbi:NADH dehydrogenase [Paraburkholderia domus]|nr:NADH dehydrogenase [Paraburkholderia domus]